MTYTAPPTTDRDMARHRLGDTSGTPSTSPATEYETDATYDALIAALGDWRLAAASIARSLAARAINDPTSFTATGDMSVSWANRAVEWRKTADELQAEVAADAAAAATVTSVALSRGGSADAEYRSDRYRRLWRV